MPNGVIAHEPSGKFDIDKLKAEAEGLAGPRRHGPRARRDHAARATPGTRRAGCGARATAAQENARVPRRRHRLRPEAQHPALPRQRRLQGDGRAGHDARPRTSWRASPTACSCPTAPAIRRRPASTRCRRSRSWSTSGLPVFGICLGHQMLGLALGAKTAQDAPGPPRRQPSGEGLHHRQGRDHLDEPRLRGRSRRRCRRASRRRTSRCSTAPTAGCG